MGILDKVRKVADVVVNLNKLDEKGFAGELKAHWELDNHFDRSLVFRNVYLTKENGSTTEIDLGSVDIKRMYQR